jgi:hypothetical protein
MAKEVSSRNTKAEIIAAYQTLEVAYKELEAKPAKVTSIATTTPPKKPKKEIAAAQPGQATMEEVIQSLRQLGEQSNTALSQLSSNLLIEASQLTEVSTTVETETGHLETLYDLKIEEKTLNDLLTQYTDSAVQYQQTMKQQRKETEKAWVEKNQAWQTETEESERHLQEQEASDNKHQKRDAQEYRYNLTLKRGVSDEEYTQQQRQQQQVLDELEETRRQAWDEREKALAEREKQFEEHKTKVEQFPKELETALKKAKDEGTGIARHQAKIKTDMAAKEFAGEEQVDQLKIRALEDQVAEQAAQLNKLSKQLEAAQKQAQELAVKAIEGASSQTSFHALKEIALEQAKNQPKAK